MTTSSIPDRLATLATLAFFDPELHIWELPGDPRTPPAWCTDPYAPLPAMLPLGRGDFSHPIDPVGRRLCTRSDGDAGYWIALDTLPPFCAVIHCDEKSELVFGETACETVTAANDIAHATDGAVVAALYDVTIGTVLDWEVEVVQTYRVTPRSTVVSRTAAPAAGVAPDATTPDRLR